MNWILPIGRIKEIDTDVSVLMRIFWSNWQFAITFRHRQPVYLQYFIENEVNVVCSCANNSSAMFILDFGDHSYPHKREEYARLRYEHILWIQRIGIWGSLALLTLAISVLLLFLRYKHLILHYYSIAYLIYWTLRHCIAYPFFNADWHWVYRDVSGSTIDRLPIRMTWNYDILLAISWIM